MNVTAPHSQERKNLPLSPWKYFSKVNNPGYQSATFGYTDELSVLPLTMPPLPWAPLLQTDTAPKTWAILSSFISPNSTSHNLFVFCLLHLPRIQPFGSLLGN